MIPLNYKGTKQMAVTWTIAQCDYKLKMTQDSKDYVNVIESIHWMADDKDSDGNSGHSYGSVGISTEDLATGWKDYSAMSEADVITMAKNALGADQVKAIEDSIAAQIAEQKTPTHGSGKPW